MKKYMTVIPTAGSKKKGKITLGADEYENRQPADEQFT
jgi:hypothetical protein